MHCGSMLKYIAVLYRQVNWRTLLCADACWGFWIVGLVGYLSTKFMYSLFALIVWFLPYFRMLMAHLCRVVVYMSLYKAPRKSSYDVRPMPWRRGLRC